MYNMTENKLIFLCNVWTGRNETNYDIFNQLYNRATRYFNDLIDIGNSLRCCY